MFAAESVFVIVFDADFKALRRATEGPAFVATQQNNLSAGIIEPALSKVKMIQFATEASITVLRIDDMIKLHPEEQQQ